jgi:ATP-dependent exoDNAse (exonuclease V) alpha subunit
MSNLQKYFQFELNPGQKETCNALLNFLDNDEDHVFIMAGYAGTGKTSILKGIFDYLDSNKNRYQLWASTGRAANVLGRITRRETKTIHSAIYMLDNNTSKLDEDDKTLSFKLKENLDYEDTIYFIDEASMIADKTETNPFLIFDDGRFLDHLFTYIGDKKVIFIGDIAQLPPINCSFSAALDGSYLYKNYHKSCKSVLLTQVMRQQLESGILWNATELRKYGEADTRPQLSIKYSGFDDIIVLRNIWSALDDFVFDLKRNGNGNSAFISFTNGGVHYLNGQIRNRLFGMKDPPLQNGEYLMVVQNNYLHKLVNGVHVDLIDFDPSPVRQGKVNYIKARIKIPGHEHPTHVYLLWELLFKKAPSLTIEEEHDIMKNFVIRMRQNGVKLKTEEFMDCFKTDPFLNALRVKFGYAVTCHKAQGGEWNKVYVNFEPMLDNIPRPNLYRWAYTAITRASKELVIPQNKYLY